MGAVHKFKVSTMSLQLTFAALFLSIASAIDCTYDGCKAKATANGHRYDYKWHDNARSCFVKPANATDPKTFEFSHCHEKNYITEFTDFLPIKCSDLKKAEDLAIANAML